MFEFSKLYQMMRTNLSSEDCTCSFNSGEGFAILFDDPCGVSNRIRSGTTIPSLPEFHPVLVYSLLHPIRVVLQHLRSDESRRITRQTSKRYYESKIDELLLTFEASLSTESRLSHICHFMQFMLLIVFELYSRNT